jgi:hypothetical protein
MIYWLVGLGFLAIISYRLLFSFAWMQVRMANLERAQILAELRADLDRLKKDNATYPEALIFIQSQIAGIKQKWPEAGWTEVKELAGKADRILWEFVAPPFFIVVAWPWITLVALLIFWFSMRKRMVRLQHLLRCVVFSYDPMPLSVVILAVGFSIPLIVSIVFRESPSYSSDHSVWFAFAVLCAFCMGLLNGAFRLRCACKHYLRLDWPGATVLATQIIVLLAVMLCLLELAPDLVRRAIF